jgi:hypothetical protein
MHYIGIGILIGIGIMLAPLVVELSVWVIGILAIFAVGAIAVGVLGLGAYGLSSLLSVHTSQPAFWIVLAVILVAIALFFGPRARAKWSVLSAEKGEAAAALIFGSAVIGILAGSAFLSGIVMESWDDPSAWLGLAFWVAFATYVIKTAKNAPAAGGGPD